MNIMRNSYKTDSGDIKVHISDELQDIFDILSIVRQLISRFLRQLIDKMYIKWEQGDEYNLEINY